MNPTETPSLQGDITPVERPRRKRPVTGRALLTQAVESALRRDRHLIVEVPDTSSWTPSWLVPVIRDAIDGAGQVVLVTASDERRRRLLSSELAEHPIDSCSFTVDTFSTVEHYLCVERLELFRGLRARLTAQVAETAGSPNSEPVGTEPAETHRLRESPLARRLAELPAISFPTLGELEQLTAASEWIEAGGSGLLTDATMHLSDRARGWATVDAEDCLGAGCPHFEGCPAQRARHSALKATVIVTDYAGLLELATPVPSGSGGGLEHRVVVLLEAHAVVDEVRRHLTWELALEFLRDILLLLTVTGAEREARGLQRAASAFFDRLTEYCHSPRYQIRLTETRPVVFADLLRKLEAASTALTQSAENTPELGARLRHAADQALSFSSRLETAMSLTETDRAIWLDTDGLGKAVIVSEPVRIARPFASVFTARSVLALSESLTVSGSLEAFRSELDVPASSNELILLPARSEVPRVLLVVPESTPDAAERSWPGTVAARFLEVLRLADASTVGCFSSSKVVAQLQETARRLLLRLPRAVRAPCEWVELAYHPSASEPAITEPTPTGNAEESYQCAVLDRLPFTPASRAWLDLLRETEPGWFKRVALPRAVTAFRQAASHVLHSKAKRVVLVVFDKRILTRPYGRAFIESLPGLTISRTLEDIPTFLKGKEAQR